MKALITLLIFPFSLLILGQNKKTVSSPAYGKFKEISTSQSYSSDQHYTNTNLTGWKKSKNNYSMGGTATQVINQTYNNVQAPNYRPNSSPQEKQQANMRYIQNRMKNDPMYQAPNRSNGFSNLAFQRHSAVLSILNEIHAEENNRRSNNSYFKSSKFLSDTKPYTNASKGLKEQLTDKKELSIADTYFYIESAFGNSYLTKNEYDKIISESVNFIKTWLIQNEYNLNDNDALHLGIQKFMSEKLTVTLASPDNTFSPKKTTHLPFFYDYEDFKGEKDFRNYFVTKSLATGSGQCNSLPAIYLVLAEGLGAKCYLAFAPQHSFIKYPDNNGRIHSYEPTSNWKISDKWYQDNMFISPKATATGIYLDTLNSKQIVANCLLDLAFGYMKKHGAANGEFVNDCITSAMQQFPKKNNINAYFVYSGLLARQLERVLYENNITDLKNINTIPQAAQLYQALLKNEEIIKKLGYQDIPEELYQQLMQEHEFKGKKQQEQHISGKQKRDLFITSF
jgi:hypothetical protein